MGGGLTGASWRSCRRLEGWNDAAGRGPDRRRMGRDPEGDPGSLRGRDGDLQVPRRETAPTRDAEGRSRAPEGRPRAEPREQAARDIGGGRARAPLRPREEDGVEDAGVRLSLRTGLR